MSMRLRSRRLFCMTGGAVLALAMAAPAALGFQEYWDGTWNYVSGDPGTMKLKQDDKEVSGKYFTEAGVKAGKIWGEVKNDGRKWVGSYKNTNDDDKGSFNAKLKSDDVSFKGTFTSANGETYDWHGEKQ